MSTELCADFQLDIDVVEERLAFETVLREDKITKS